MGYSVWGRKESDVTEHNKHNCNPCSTVSSMRGPGLNPRAWQNLA